MKRLAIKILLFAPLLFYAYELCADSKYSHSIFVPRQLSYNPILEEALTFSELKDAEDWHYHLAAKPIYTQSVGSSFKRYFTIGQQDTMQVREDGSGNIDSLWLQVIASNSTFYRSDLSFDPVRKTFGALFYFNFKLPHMFYLSINTALVTNKTNVCMNEENIKNRGTGNYLTVTDSLTTDTRVYGRVCGSASKTGLDDIQVKLIRTMHDCEHFSWDVYGLLGLPTNTGAKSKCLFEPLVGSKHAQIGLGTTYRRTLPGLLKAVPELCDHECTLVAECKWRYGFSAHERRLFDITKNGEWSRYMLLVAEEATSNTFFASNALALKADVTPRNSLDIYLALHAQKNAWQFEVGYDFWFRNAEKISLDDVNFPTNLGIADLLGIANLDPESASQANITQGLLFGSNRMVSDPAFVTITVADLNLCSGAAPRSISNSFYGSVAYRYDYKYITQIGLNVAYELGQGTNVPDNVYAWLTADVTF